MKMIEHPAAPGPAPHTDMSWVPARTFRMGSDHHYPEEAPAHKVSVSGAVPDQAGRPLRGMIALGVFAGSPHKDRAEVRHRRGIDGPAESQRSS